MNNSSASRWTGTNDPTSIRATNAPCRRSLVREAGPSPRSSPRPARSSSAARISRRTGSTADPASAPSSRRCSRRIAPAESQVEAQAEAIRRAVTADLDEATPGDLSPSALEDATQGMSRVFDTDARRIREPAKVSSPRRAHLSAAPLVRYPRGDTRTHHRPNPPGDGSRRRIRPARRWLPSLQRRCTVDRSALREDVVRQLRAAEGLCRRLCPLRHRGVRRGCARDRPLGARGDGRPRRRVRGEPGRRRRDWTTMGTISPGRAKKRPPN